LANALCVSAMLLVHSWVIQLERIMFLEIFVLLNCVLHVHLPDATVYQWNSLSTLISKNVLRDIRKYHYRINVEYLYTSWNSRNMGTSGPSLTYGMVQTKRNPNQHSDPIE
jgi:hypothetical protein